MRGFDQGSAQECPLSPRRKMETGDSWVGLKWVSRMPGMHRGLWRGIRMLMGYGNIRGWKSLAERAVTGEEKGCGKRRDETRWEEKEKDCGQRRGERDSHDLCRICWITCRCPTPPPHGWPLLEAQTLALLKWNVFFHICSLFLNFLIQWVNSNFPSWKSFCQ